MEIYLAEFEPLRETEGILPSLVMQVISKAELSKMTKNGGNNLGLKETDGPLLCQSSFLRVFSRVLNDCFLCSAFDCDLVERSQRR